MHTICFEGYTLCTSYQTRISLYTCCVFHFFLFLALNTLLEFIENSVLDFSSKIGRRVFLLVIQGLSYMRL